MTLVNLMPRNAFGPLELVNLPSELNGSVGNNRAVGGRPQISAQNDVDAVKAWLARFVDTRTTFDSYRKEAERLLLWTVTELGKPLSSLSHEDLLLYRRFLSDPQPVARWVMAKGRKWPQTVLWAAVCQQSATSDCHPEHDVRLACECWVPCWQSAIPLSTAPAAVEAPNHPIPR